MDKDIFWKGSNAVDNARIWIGVFSWIDLIVGIALLIFSFGETAPLTIGAILIASAISGFILRAILRGFETIVKASEAYLQDRHELKEQAKQSAE